MADKKRTKITFKTPLFRGSFVYLTRPKTVEKEDGSEKEVYQIFIPLPKGKPSTKAFLQEFAAARDACTKEKFGAVIDKSKLKDYPIKNGDEMDNEQFHGHWCINASSNFRPSVVDKHGDLLEGEDEAYSGAWYKANLSIWGWEYKKRKGISVNIESAVLLKDDKKFGGGSNAAEDFADDLEASDNDDEESGDGNKGDEDGEEESRPAKKRKKLC